MLYPIAGLKIKDFDNLSPMDKALWRLWKECHIEHLATIPFFAKYVEWPGGRKYCMGSKGPIEIT